MKVHPLTGYDTGIPAGLTGYVVSVRTGGSTGKVGSFGMTRRGGTKMHKGTDYIAKTGAAVFAVMDGIVTRCGESWPRGGIVQDGRKGYGYRCYVRHNVTGDGKKVETRYAHLSGLAVEKDQRVRAGELLGWVGRSGNVDKETPSHLHFEVRINGNPTDPEVWLR